MRLNATILRSAPELTHAFLLHAMSGMMNARVNPSVLMLLTSKVISG